MIGRGSTTTALTEPDVRGIVAEFADRERLGGKHVPTELSGGRMKDPVRDSTMATVEQVRAFAQGGSARIQR